MHDFLTAEENEFYTKLYNGVLNFAEVFDYYKLLKSISMKFRMADYEVTAKDICIQKLIDSYLDYVEIV